MRFSLVLRSRNSRLFWAGAAIALVGLVFFVFVTLRPPTRAERAVSVAEARLAEVLNDPNMSDRKRAFAAEEYTQAQERYARKIGQVRVWQSIGAITTLIALPFVLVNPKRRRLAPGT